MTRTQRRTYVKTGLAIAVALLFLIALLALSLSFSGGGQTQAETKYGERDDYVTVSNVKGTGAKAPEGNTITTAEHLKYLFFNEGALGTFTLGKDFKITDPDWMNTSPVLQAGATLLGDGHEIWVSALGESASTTTSVVGGLVSVNYGTIQNLVYYYSGSMVVLKNAASDEGVIAGGMVGINVGMIDNCKINVDGAILTESKTESVTTYAGGVVGYNYGELKNCSEIIVSGSLECYTDQDTDSSRAKHNVIYAGGVVGKIISGTFSGNTINASASVIAADNTAKWNEDGGWMSLINAGTSYFGFDLSDYVNTAYNDKEHVHPAGVVMGALGGDATVSANEIAVNGSAMSYGMLGSSNSGCIAGGFIGELSPDINGATVQSNYVKLGCSLSGFVMDTGEIADALLAWFKTRSINVCLGACIGKCNGTAANFINNCFYIDRDSGIVEDGADFDDDTYSSSVGLFSGNAFDSPGNIIKENNWLVRNLTECATARVAGNDTFSISPLNHLCIFGDGKIVPENVTGAVSAITLKAKPICSPFYGWTDEIGSADPSFNKSDTLTVGSATNQVQFAVFIDTEIESSGELTQLAKDINLIKQKVWKGLSSKNSDHLMYFGGKSAPTLRWLTVNLKRTSP